MVFAIGEGFWGRGVSEEQALAAAKKYAPAAKRGRIRASKLDFYFIADADAEGAHVDDVGNFVHKKGVTPMKLKVNL